MSENSPTQQQIEQWKKDFGGVYHLQYDDKQCWIRDPLNDLNVMKRGFAAMQKGSVSLFTETIIVNCFLAGDEETKSEEKYINGLEEDISEVTNIPDAEVRKSADGYEVDVEGFKIGFRKATRHDIKKAEKRNPGMSPLKTQEALLNELVIDKDDFQTIKTETRIYLGFLLAADKLKEKATVSIKKL